MIDPIATAVSVLSLLVSGTTAWLMLFRRGRVRMIQPTVIFFGPDGGPRPALEPPSPKVFLRTLLFSTSKRGTVIESMHVTLTRNESRQNFNVWAYGDTKLVRGSGLFVGEAGVATNHHFLIPHNVRSFLFDAGKYRIEVFATILGRKHHTLLFSQEVDISHDEAFALADGNAGIYFDWGPDSRRYHSHIDTRQPQDSAERILEVLELAGESSDKRRGGPGE